MTDFIEIPHNLVFDDDSVESDRYDERSMKPKPASVIDLWDMGENISEEAAEALAAILASHPELVRSVSRLDDLEILLRAALKSAIEKEGCSNRAAASRMYALANLLQSIDKIDEAEELYRHALDTQQKEIGLCFEETLRTIAGLAMVLDKQGKSEEAASLRVQYAIEQLTRKGDEDSLEKLRSIALEHYVAGDYDIAEDIYRRMLGKNFQIAGTSCHLARVLIMANREKEARYQLSLAWDRRAQALPYVPPRILFFEITFAFLDGEDPQNYLSRMKHLLRQKNTETEMMWTMEPVINHLKSRLSPNVIDFLIALVAALSEWKNVAELDRFEIWRNLPLNQSA